VGDVDSLHIEIDNLNDPLVRFCFIRSINMEYTRIGSPVRASQLVDPFWCPNQPESVRLGRAVDTNMRSGRGRGNPRERRKYFSGPGKRALRCINNIFRIFKRKNTNILKIKP
jgi:hypothetical protein